MRLPWARPAPPSWLNGETLERAHSALARALEHAPRDDEGRVLVFAFAEDRLVAKFPIDAIELVLSGQGRLPHEPAPNPAPARFSSGGVGIPGGGASSPSPPASRRNGGALPIPFEAEDERWSRR